jgi:hypothetical protein
MKLDGEDLGPIRRALRGPFPAATNQVELVVNLVARRTGASLVGAEAVEALPTTQGEAAEFVDRHLRDLGI